MGNTSAHQELEEKAREVVREAIMSFGFDNYGLDELEEIKGEAWHVDLTRHITDSLFGGK